VRFSEFHVWAALEDGSKDVLAIGISDFGQRSLGDILCVELPKMGDQVTNGAALGWVDCYRRAFDIVSPVSGEVIEINDAVVAHPAHINAYPYARTGVLKVRVKTLRGYEEFLRFEAYADVVRRLRRYDEWTKDQRMT
jgi:glycine cleavage system H lipoate-binding protein